MNDIITEEELTDMFGEGGKEEVKDYYAHEKIKEECCHLWKYKPVGNRICSRCDVLEN